VQLTDEQVVAALPNGATLKYGEVVQAIRDSASLDGYALYRAVAPILQRLRREGRVELVRGAGSGWRLPCPAPLRGPVVSTAASTIRADTMTDRQIRELRATLFARPADRRQLLGLVACHDALGHSHRRASARARCVDLMSEVPLGPTRRGTT
jgi:hypothetical protein